MLTPPPVNAGTPRGAAVEPCNSPAAQRITSDQLLLALGAMIDIAARASGRLTPDVAEWAGTTLIRWAEQDRALTRRPLDRGDDAMLPRLPE